MSTETESENINNKFSRVVFIVDSLSSGMRIDVFLCRKMKRISRHRIQDMIRRGQVSLNAEPVRRSSQRLTEDSVVSFFKPLPVEDETLPEVQVLVHDPPLLALCKPGNLTVHPTAGVLKRTLTHWLSVNGFEDYTPSHRLDRETSGLIICAQKGSSSGIIKKAFEQRLTSKAYLCIVKGIPTKTFTVDRPLGPDLNSPIKIKMAVVDDGQESRTDFITLSSTTTFSLVLAFPRTGRQHQIRAHLEYAGFPIGGDKIYGCSSDVFLRFIEEGMTESLLETTIFTRQMLHSIALSVPLSGNPLFFYAPVPIDFQDAVTQANLTIPEGSEIIEIIKEYLV
ncbi:RluA family pseudouridine synthase [Myxococcota bacterium]|nr:RluA family pseudouridine synthase [Myxococcota bacterium]MBU1380273.1 RluA family pseudouridine synthase [Myxococcota bacterium]MBU1496386.1 RluA family pseudouridine synthase [Myxococcota bacterium]